MYIYIYIRHDYTIYGLLFGHIMPYYLMLLCDTNVPPFWDPEIAI